MTDEEIETSFNEEQPEKAAIPISLIEEGMTILVNEQHPLKIDDLNFVTVEGISHSLSNEQPSKIPNLNSFIKEDKIVTLVKDEQPLKELLPISLT